jgi:nitrite reductase/ring-hydroxylating ferredoxin subunit/multimeric flavodoxin WrbA
MDYVEVLRREELPVDTQTVVVVGGVRVALFNREGEISAIGNTCLHKGGPLAQGKISRKDDGWYVTCPWHGWDYNLKTGKAPAGYHDQQSVYDVKVEDEKIFVSTRPTVRAVRAEHDMTPIADLLSLEYQTTPASLNVLGISTTNMNEELPRASTSEMALELALVIAEKDHGASTKMIKLRDARFRACEGYYSQSEKACTWPCSISEMDIHDGMNPVYRAMVLWADIVLLATPIRWGNASALYYKMIERLNCVQNQITLHDRILIKNKVAAFLITGGQDNIQSVAGQMLVFFSDIGFAIPPFPFVGWSRGWIAEDMEHNVSSFARSRYIRRSVKELVKNSVMLSRQIKTTPVIEMHTPLPRIMEAPSNVKENPS